MNARSHLVCLFLQFSSEVTKTQWIIGKTEISNELDSMNQINGVHSIKAHNHLKQKLVTWSFKTRITEHGNNVLKNTKIVRFSSIIYFCF